MAIISCWAAKGGVGCTVVAAGIALAARGRTIIVDLAGDMPAALGLPEPAGQGLAEWLSSDAPAHAALHLAVEVDASTRLIARGAAPIDAAAPRWAELASWMADERRQFVVDCGSCPPPRALAATADAEGGAGGRRELLVTRPCYLALRRAIGLGARPDGVIVVDDRDHSLDRHDVARSIGAPVVAEVSTDPAVARAVDAGLLAVRVPASLLRPLRPIVAQGRRAAA